jgi:hypothetical protein
MKFFTWDDVCLPKEKLVDDIAVMDEGVGKS